MDVLQEDFQFDDFAETSTGEVSRSHHQQNHAPQSLVSQETDILQAITLLDEADRFLHPPAAQVLNYMRWLSGLLD